LFDFLEEDLNACDTNISLLLSFTLSFAPAWRHTRKWW